jgi:hypothetical protein
MVPIVPGNFGRDTFTGAAGYYGTATILRQLTSD